MTEWTGRQQIVLFLQSGLLGVTLGLLFDVFNIADKRRHQRRWLVFLCDVLFFLLAAIVTFYFSLAWMDGKMHPLLFVGCIGGFVLEHCLLGRYSSGWIYRFFCRLYKIGCAIGLLILWPFRWLYRCVRRVLQGLREKLSKNSLKTRKKKTFFRKKS